MHVAAVKPRRRTRTMMRDNNSSVVPHKRQEGFALLLLLAMAAAVAIALYKELPRLVFESQRILEQDLIFRGEQYRRAIQLYVRKFKRYPASLEDLEGAAGVRFLRRRYRDPMTGRDEWRLIHIDATGVFTDSLLYKPRESKGTDRTPGQTSSFITERPAFGSTEPAVTSPESPEPGQPFRRGASDRPPVAAESFLEGAAAAGRETGSVASPSEAAWGPPVQAPGEPTAYGPLGVGALAPPAGQPSTPWEQQATLGPPPLGMEGQSVPGPPVAFGVPGVQQGQLQPAAGQVPAGLMPAQSPSGAGAVAGLAGGAAPSQPAGLGVVPAFLLPGGQPGQSAGVPAQTVVKTFGPPAVGRLAPGQEASGGATPTPFGQAYVPFVPQPPSAGGASASGAGVAVVPSPALPPQPAPLGTAGPSQPSGQNPAIQLIQQILTSPRPGGPPTAAAAGAAQPQLIGGGIAGVATTSRGESIMVYQGRTRYEEWEFIYDFRRDPALLRATPGVVQARPQGPGTSGVAPSAPNLGFPSGQPMGGSFGSGQRPGTQRR